MPRKPKNADVRKREHLTEAEIDKLLGAARKTRHGHRDETMVLLAFRHGFRVSELVALRWDQVELKGGRLHVTRLKNGEPSTHTLQGDEIRALRRLEQAGPYVFESERGGPMTDANVRKLVARLGEAARLGFPVHPHMLRHSTGYALVQAGHDTRRIQQWLGHRNIAHTVRYTRLSDEPFSDFWRTPRRHK
jgi:type 1 fimbriae regulatory protein FimB/type 1 fimbriae regulatory protein FimE